MADTTEESKGPGFLGWLILVIAGFIIAPTDVIADRIVRPLGRAFRDFLHIAGDGVREGVEHARIWLVTYGYTVVVWTRGIFATALGLFVLGLAFHEHTLGSRVLIALSGLLPGFWLFMVRFAAEPLLYLLTSARNLTGGFLATAGKRLGVPELSAIKEDSAEFKAEIDKLVITIRKTLLTLIVVVGGCTAVLIAAPHPMTVPYVIIAAVFVFLAIMASEARGGNLKWGFHVVEILALIGGSITLGLVAMRIWSPVAYAQVFNLFNGAESWIGNPTWPHFGAVGATVACILIPAILSGLAGAFSKSAKLGPAFRGLSSAAWLAAIPVFILLCVTGTISWKKLRAHARAVPTHSVAAESATTQPVDPNRKVVLAPESNPAPEPHTAPPPPRPALEAKDLQGQSDLDILMRSMKELNGK